MKDGRAEVELDTEGEQAREQPGIVGSRCKGVITTDREVKRRTRETCDSALCFRIEPGAGALVFARRREAILANGSNKGTTFIVEALITAVRDVEKEVVGIGKITVRHAEDGAGGAGEARLRKIALKVHERDHDEKINTHRETELNQTENPGEFWAIGTSSNVKRAVGRRYTRDNEALWRWRRTRGRRRGSSARGFEDGVEKQYTQIREGMGRWRWRNWSKRRHFMQECCGCARQWATMK
ncbi:hypothetical protein B0H14DRAFT_2913970 [Mycena olivaceomarginata]|nr:hypothetical protein B0H14DRAFT_2913970 [Mycena olivaceomarginata]